MIYGRRLFFESPKGILHPVQVPLSVPFNYDHALYQETFNPDMGDGFIGFDQSNERGIRFYPKQQQGASVVAQSYQRVQAQANRRTLLATRFYLDHFNEMDILIGFWETATDPFGTTPNNAVMFKLVGAQIPSLVYAVTIANGTSHEELVFETGDDWYEVAIILHELEGAEFLWRRKDGPTGPNQNWTSIVITDNFPTVAMRPGIACKRVLLFAIAAVVVQSSQIIQEGIP